MNKKLSIRMYKQKMNTLTKSGNKTYKSFVQQLLHDFRFEEMDSTYLKRPSEKNKYIINNKLYSSNEKINTLELQKQVQLEFDNIQLDYQRHNNKKFHKQTKPTLNFLLSFSKDFDLPEEQRKQQLESVYKFIQKRFGQVIYLVQHNDEKALHYSFTIYNYDYKTHRPIAKQIDTSKLQDQIAEHLKSEGQDYGHTRGEPKSISLAKHRTIIEGKVLEAEQKEKELQEKIKQLENQNKELQEKNDRLLKITNQYEIDIIKLKELQEEAQADYESVLNEIIEDLEDMAEQETLDGFVKKLRRYIKNENKDRLETLLNNVKKKTKKIKKANNKRGMNNPL